MYGVSPGQPPHQYYSSPPYSEPSRVREQQVSRTGSSSQPDFSYRSGNSSRPDSSAKKAKTESKEDQPSFLVRNSGKITLAGGAAKVAGLLICFASVPAGICLFSADALTFWFGLAHTGLINKILDF